MMADRAGGLWGVVRGAGGVLFVLLVLVSSIYSVVITVPPILPLAFLRPPLFAWIVELVGACWHTYVVALYELVYGVKVVICGDVRKAPPGQCVLTIMNHRTRLDWLFFYSFHVRFGSLRYMKVFVKDALKHLPGCGWAMQTVVFPFLRRRWAQDSGLMASRFRYYAAVGSRPHLLLFPEGTDLTESTLRASHAFAASKGLPPLQHVLQPRTTGFVFAVSQLRQLRLCDKVLDVTVGYPRGVPRGEGDLVLGEFPREVHFHVEEVGAEALPSSQEGLETWCRQRWALKEQRLAQFYRRGRFPEEDKVVPDAAVLARMVASLVFWTVLTLVMTYKVVTLTWVTWYVLGVILALVVVTTTLGGLDSVLPALSEFSQHRAAS